ncbi:MAG: ATP-grasp domain-containing protein [Acidobacteria bacterium]|nr:ATP-grasp domain-containing protein [Acidobacteriota bacterium]
MRRVVFVAPYFLETTLRFLEATLDLPDTCVGLVSQERLERLPPRLRARLGAHYRVDDALDVGKLTHATRLLRGELGSVDVLMGVLEHLQVQLAAVRAELGIPGLGVEAAKNFRDKARMKSALRAAGLPCARHRLVSTLSAAREFAGVVGYPLVIKPPAGAGAKGTHRIDTAGALEEALAIYRVGPSAEMLLEEFVSGAEYSFDSIVIDGRAVWHSFSRYLPSPLEVLENDWIQWCVLLPREIDAAPFDGFSEIGFRAVQELGLETGLSHMEWFDRGELGVAISEVGARPPGARITTLLSYAHDFDFYRGWARLMVFGEFDPPERPYAAGAAYLRAQGKSRGKGESPGRVVAAIQGLDRAQAELGELVVEAQLPERGQPINDSYEGEGYVIVRHPETAVVENALRRLVSLIRVEAGS